MKQTNTSGQTLAVPSLGVDVPPGGTVEATGLLPGFEPASDKPAPRKPATADTTAPKE